MRPRSRTPHLPIAAVSFLVLVAASKAQTVTPGLASRPDASTSGVATKGQTLTYGVDAGVAESDNVTLVSTGKVSQTMAVADPGFDFKERSRRLDVDAKGNFTSLDYLQSAYSSQVIARFDRLEHLALIPERLAWVCPLCLRPYALV